MANVSFYRQTTGSTATGAITFDTTNKYIYLGDGSTAHKFDCNNTNTDTKNTAGSSNTSSKIYLIGATSQATNPTTYSHDTAYVGTDGHLYSNGAQVINKTNSAWVICNYTYSQISSIPAAAREIYVSWGCPIKNLTEGDVSSTTKLYTQGVLVRCDRNTTGFANAWQPTASWTFHGSVSNKIFATGYLYYTTAYDTSGSWAWNGACLLCTGTNSTTWSYANSRCYGTLSASYNSYSETFGGLTIQAYRF